jgi:hypothetical protein
MGMLDNPKLMASLIGAGALATPSDAEGMYVGAKPTDMGAFSSLMDRMVRKVHEPHGPDAEGGN